MPRRLQSVFIGLALLAAEGEAQTSLARPADSIADVLGRVSQDSLRATIAGLQGFGTRLYTDANRKEIAVWVQARIQRAGVANVVLDSFQVGATWQYNVVGTLLGTANPGQEIILGAHTDSYNRAGGLAPGADDNASGTAAVLEIARVLCQAAYTPRATFRFIGFAAEEAGLLGSASYAGRASVASAKISAMLNFDMIGHRNASSTAREFSLVWYTGAESLMALDSLMARTYTTLVPVPTTNARSGSDSYSFWTNGFPALFHYERGSNPTYHTALDILDSLDLSYAAEITQAGLATALSVDAGVAALPVPTLLPREVALSQNYPNPFNPATVIAFEIPESRHVTLAVFDLLGREVARVIDGWMEGGSHTTRFDARGLSSGVYLYRLTAGSAALTRRMVVVR